MNIKMNIKNEYKKWIWKMNIKNEHKKMKKTTMLNNTRRTRKFWNRKTNFRLKFWL